VAGQARAGEWILADFSETQRTIDVFEPHPVIAFRVCESPELREFFEVCYPPDEPSSSLVTERLDELDDAEEAAGSDSLIELATELPGGILASIGGMEGSFPKDFHGDLFSQREEAPIVASIEDGGAFTALRSSRQLGDGRFGWLLFGGSHQIIGEDAMVWMGLAEIRFRSLHAEREPELRLGIAAASQRWCPGSGFKGDAGWALQLDRCASSGVNASVDFSLLTSPHTRTEFSVLVSHGLFGGDEEAAEFEPSISPLSPGATTAANFEIRSDLGGSLVARVGYSSVRYHEPGRSSHKGFAGIQIRF
jgi:hypothetical protein